MDQEEIINSLRAGRGITLIILATTKINVEFAREFCFNYDAVVIGAQHGMRAAGIEDLSFPTPMQGLQVVKSYFFWLVWRSLRTIIFRSTNKP
ncbi:hypothetical protein [Xanthomonas arboricola]|uniref:hypothetical protein n=1 Tax=Xanthomonas arboricola TaxID=56448 RepID=UPI0011B04347|nr:hypothetical protein [Xanthomonas arboricola]